MYFNMFFFFTVGYPDLNNGQVCCPVLPSNSSDHLNDLESWADPEVTVTPKSTVVSAQTN